jgi:hypothetical protein
MESIIQDDEATNSNVSNYASDEEEEIEEEEGASVFDVNWKEFSNCGRDSKNYGLPKFLGDPPGNLKPALIAFDALRFFLDEDLVQTLVYKTNSKMRAKLQGRRDSNFKAFDRNEFFVFFAVLVLTQIHGKNNMRENWSTNKYLFTPIFGEMMARDRY